MTALAIADLRPNLGYLKPGDIDRIEAAYQFSDAAHMGQLRKSGAPYISHPLAVAEIVASWQLDAQAVMAADTLLSALVTAGQVDRGAAQALRPDLDRAYALARDANRWDPAAFRGTLAQIAGRLRGLK